MIGTGALSLNLIKAHASVRPIKNVFVWGRNFKKAKAICKELKNESYSVNAIETIEDKISEKLIIENLSLLEDEHEFNLIELPKNVIRPRDKNYLSPLRIVLFTCYPIKQKYL